MSESCNAKRRRSCPEEDRFHAFHERLGWQRGAVSELGLNAGDGRCTETELWVLAVVGAFSCGCFSKPVVGAFLNQVWVLAFKPGVGALNQWSALKPGSSTLNR
jgi:hypothetical protein